MFVCASVCVACLTVYERFSFSSRCPIVSWAGFAPVCVCQWNCLRDESVQCTLLLCELGRLGSLVSDCVMCLRSVWRVRLLVLCVCVRRSSGVCWLLFQPGRRYHGAGCATEAFMCCPFAAALAAAAAAVRLASIVGSRLPFSLCWPPPCEPTNPLRLLVCLSQVSLAFFSALAAAAAVHTAHRTRQQQAASGRQPTSAGSSSPARANANETHRAFRAAVIIISAGQQLRPKTQTKPEASDYTALQCAS